MISACKGEQHSSIEDRETDGLLIRWKSNASKWYHGRLDRDILRPQGTVNSGPLNDADLQGAVWSAKVSDDASKAVSASADFTVYAIFTYSQRLMKANSGIHILAKRFKRSLTITLSEVSTFPRLRT